VGISVCARTGASGTVLVISGELDAAASGPFQETILHAARSFRSPLLLDLSGVEFADCTGLRALATIKQLIEARNCRVQIVGASPALRSVARSAGTQHVLQQVPVPAQSPPRETAGVTRVRVVQAPPEPRGGRVRG
jgi:anti-anti-sigma factor